MHSSAVTVDLKEVQTNMVLLHTDNIRVNAKKLCDRLALVTNNNNNNKFYFLTSVEAR